MPDGVEIEMHRNRLDFVILSGQVMAISTIRDT